MIDQSTDLLSLPLPHPNNRLDEDVVRLRSALALIDELLANRAGLGPDGKLLPSQIPDMVITDYLGTVNSQASMLQLTGQKGDWCIRTDEARVWVVTGPSAASIGSWTALAYPNTSGVTSINSRTGVVTLTKADLGLSNVDDTSDLAKPISTAVANALAGKQATITGAASSVVETLLTAGRVVISDGFGRIAVSSITADILSYLSGATGNIQNQLGLRISKTSNTGSAALPVGTTSQRDVAPVTGSIRYNTTTAQFEGYYASSWRTIGDTVSLSSISDWPADVGATEVGYLDGVTSSIQTQISNLSSSISGLSSGKQAADADLTAIAALSGSYGYLKKTAEGVWTIDAGTGSGGGTGTVTSVSLSAPTNVFTVSGSPVTTAGTLTMTLANQSANQVFAGPSTGSAAAPSFRALVAADIPNLSAVYQPVNSKLTDLTSSSITGNRVWASPRNGSAGPASFRTVDGADFGPQSNNYVLAAARQSGDSTSPAFRALVAADIPNLSSVYQPVNANLTALSSGNLQYTGTMTGSTGVLNIGSGQVYKDTSGRVGLGLTPSAWQYKSLEINAAGCGLYSGASGQIGIAANAYWNSGWKYGVTGVAACAMSFSSGSISTFTTAATGSAGGAVTLAAGPYVAAGDTVWTNGSSDARIKKNLTGVPGLSAVLAIDPVSYHFAWDADTDCKRLGFLAQNVRPVIPEMVAEKDELAEDGTPLLTVKPDYLLPVLVQAIKDLSARVLELENLYSVK